MCSQERERVERAASSLELVAPNGGFEEFGATERGGCVSLEDLEAPKWLSFSSPVRVPLKPPKKVPKQTHRTGPRKIKLSI